MSNLVLLIDLEPKWFGENGRHGQGITFLCPHCRQVRLAVAFKNPIDDGHRVDLNRAALWRIVQNGGSPVIPPSVHLHRDGDTFGALNLTPMVDASEQGHWVGFVTRGEIS